MKKDKIVVLLTGGGTGGHIYPLLAVAANLREIADKKNIGLDLVYLGAAGPYKPLLEERGITVNSLLSGKWRRYFSLLNILDIPKFFLGLIQAFLKVFFIMPDAVFSKGGPGALAVVIVAWFYRIPVTIHESDSLPGLTNLISSRFAKKVAVSFAKTLNYFPASKVFLTGNPIRPDLFIGRENQAEAKEKLGFDPQKFLIFVVGGSQGSRKINELILNTIEAIIKETQILHQVGAGNYGEVEKLRNAFFQDRPSLERLAYKIVPYLTNDYKTALTAADLVISRAGAGAIFETASFSKPMLLIPLRESANDHQRSNTQEAVNAGFAMVIEEENLLPNIFVNQLKRLLGNPELLKLMSEKAGRFSRLDAGKIIAEEILS